MQITDEMVEAACAAYDASDADTHLGEMRDALEAALGASSGNASELPAKLRNIFPPLRHDFLDAAACIEDLAGALKEVLVGGNHLTLLIRHGHPSANATPRDAACHYGPDIPAYNAWCCWSSIMRARAALERWGLK